MVCSSGNVCPMSERSKPVTANNFLFELAILIWSISSQPATNKMEKQSQMHLDANELKYAWHESKNTNHS